MSERPKLFTGRGLLEVAAIVGSILLAFAIDAAWESAQEDRLAREALISLRAEFEFERAEVARHGQRWADVRGATQRLLDTLTDESLALPVGDEQRTVGRTAWHIVLTIPEMLERTGMRPDGPAEDAPVPATAAEVADAYRRVSGSLVAQIEESWTDETLQTEDMLFGQPWKRATTLFTLVLHEVHHRGQLTVLMRQAGLTPVGVMGPVREDWARMGRNPPAV